MSYKWPYKISRVLVVIVVMCWLFCEGLQRSYIRDIQQTSGHNGQHVRNEH